MSSDEVPETIPGAGEIADEGAFVDEAGPEKPKGIEETVDDVGTTVGTTVGKGSARESTASGAGQHVHFADHFSLGAPSSTVRYRGHRVTVYDSNQEQMLMEESPNKQETVTVKRVRTATFGLLVLKAFYTLPTLLLLGFHFVLCFQVFLFLFINLLVTAGYTTDSPTVDTKALLGSILSIPLFVYGLASLMSYCTFFVSDTWNGQRLFRSLLKVEAVILEWVSLSIFVIIPLLALAISLAAGLDDWWEVTLSVLMICVYGMFLVFAFFVFCSEFQFCVDLVEACSEEDSSTWIGFMRHSMLTTQKHRYAGLRSEQYNVYGNQRPPPEGSYSLSPDHQPVKVLSRPYSRLSLRVGAVFDKVEPPRRRWTVGELREAEPIITKKNWSLERLYCRGYGAPTIFSLQGPDGLTRWQLLSTIGCSGLGLFLMAFVLLSMFGWYGFGASAIIAVIVVMIFCCVIPLVSHSRLFAAAVVAAPDGDEEDDDKVAGSSIYQVWEKVTISTPKEWYCWARMILEIAFLFVWPLTTLFITRSYPLAVFFIVIGFFTFFRLYFDAGAILSDEVGSMDTASMATPRASIRYWLRQSSTSGTTNSMKTQGDDEAMMGKARTSIILGQITHSPFVLRWIMVFVITAIVIYVLFSLANGSEGGAIPSEGRSPMAFVSDFEYPGVAEELKYGSCNIPAGDFTAPASGDLVLADYSILAALAYETTEASQLSMDTLFGNGTLIDDEELVNQYREETRSANRGVYYKLLRFSSNPNVAIVSIRGTETAVDTIVNAQLWASSLLTQLLQVFMPFGWVFYDIYDDLVDGVSWMESSKVERVSYYKETTGFVKALIDDNYGGKDIQEIRVTGASLGGGLAIITGAQAGPHVSTIALSGPNVRLAHGAVTPPVTVEDLDTKTFNIIPDRDFIARVGGINTNVQHIGCIKPANSLIGCHSMFQSYCQLQVNCGSNGRPVFCRCALDHGFDEPEGRDNTTSFREACEAAQQEVIDTLPAVFEPWLEKQGRR